MVPLQEQIYDTVFFSRHVAFCIWNCPASSLSATDDNPDARSAVMLSLQVLVCQLLLDSIKAYNSLLPLVIALPQQDLARTGELAVNVTSSDVPLRQQTCAVCLQLLAGYCDFNMACICLVQNWLCITALQAIPKSISVHMASAAIMRCVMQAVIPGLQMLIPFAVCLQL